MTWIAAGSCLQMKCQWVLGNRLWPSEEVFLATFFSPFFDFYRWFIAFRNLYWQWPKLLCRLGRWLVAGHVRTQDSSRRPSKSPTNSLPDLIAPSELMMIAICFCENICFSIGALGMPRRLSFERLRMWGGKKTPTCVRQRTCFHSNERKRKAGSVQQVPTQVLSR